MRKIKLTFLLGMFLASLPAIAQTEEDAKNAALDFLKQKKGNAKLELSSSKLDVGTTSSNAKSVGSSSTKSTGEVYAFNVQGGGFALVCTGNGNTAVAGYSDSGSLDVDNVPEAMKTWLTGYQAVMASSSLATKEPGWEGPSVTPVAPLIKTQWGQSAPYNCKCPSDGKQTAIVGCVPVALAQVLNYYHQNQKGGGSLKYAHVDSETEYEIDYSSTTYDWKNMLNSYIEPGITQTQKDAVGKLMLECGIACKADFDYTSTSANMPFVALNKYYNYECMYVARESHYSIGWGYSSDYHISTDKWMSMIQEELTAGRPIIYSASDLPGGSGMYVKPAANHCFVIDGIDSQNYVHVNWGWTGIADGYYDVAVLNPGGNFNYEQGYRCDHSMIIGIKPRATAYYSDEVCQPFVVCDWQTGRGDAVKSKQKSSISTRSVSSIVTSKEKMIFQLISSTYENKKFEFTTVLAKDGKIVKNLPGGYYNETLNGWPSINRWNLSQGFNKVPTDVADGVYEIRTAYKDADGRTQLCPAPKQIIPTMEIVNKGTGMIIHGLEGEDLMKTLTIEDIQPASEIFAGTKFYLYLKAKGSTNNSYLQFKNVETGKVYGTSNTSSFSFKHLYDNYTSVKAVGLSPINVENSFTMPAGRYLVMLPEKETSISLAKDFYIDVKEKPSYPILDGIDLAWCHFFGYNPDETYSLGYNSLENTECLKTVRPEFQYANKVKEPVTVNVYMVNKDNGAERLVASLKNWTPGQTRPLELKPYPLSGNFEFKCKYLTPDGERASLMPTENYEREPYHNYNIENNVEGVSYPCELVSWSKKTSTASERMAGTGQFTTSVQLGLRVSLDSYDKGDVITKYAVVKALFFDKKSKEVVVDSVTNVIIANKLICSYTLTPQLTDNSKYSVCVLYANHNWGWSRNEYSYVLNSDKSIAEFELVNDGTTSIAKISTFSSIFKQGETVRVYDMNGILVRTLAASPDLWSNLLSTLPSGVFVLKSSSQTIKFRK